MKKLIPLLLLLSVCSLSYAESMKFITVLSSPVGTFNKLEAVDPDQPAKGNTVNFCTNIGTQGVVELKGTKTADLNIVSLANNTTLGKTDEGKFSLNNITLNQGGSIKGGRLFGNTVTVNNAASGKAGNLYGNQLTVAGAKTKTLDVNSGASKITAQHEAAEMVWSNQYQEDDACKTGSACARQYLLKEKGAAVQDCSTPPDGKWHIVSKQCSAGGTLYAAWDKAKCDYVPEQYVEIELTCMTNYCSSDSWEDGDGVNINQLVTLYGGCRLSKNSPVQVDLYYKTLNATSWSSWGQIYPGELREWESGWNKLDCNCYSSEMRTFALDHKGNTRTIKTVGDCRYYIEIDSSQSDEEWGSRYCNTASNWM